MPDKKAAYLVGFGKPVPGALNEPIVILASGLSDVLQKFFDWHPPINAHDLDQVWVKPLGDYIE